MKILYIADTYEIGGAFLSFINIINNIKKNHTDIVPVVLSSKYGKNNIVADRNGIENYDIGHKAFFINNGSTIPRKCIRIILRPFLKIQYLLANKNAVTKAEKLIDFSSVDLIHSNSNRNDIGAILAKKHNIPHIWHLREYGDDCFTLRNDYIEFMNEHTDCFIAISKAVAFRWVEKGIDPKKIVVVYNGIANNIHYADKKTDKQISRGVITGFISPFKGQYDLIKAINTIKSYLRGRFQLDIYGNVAFEYLLRLKAYVILHGLSDLVRFKGYVSDVERLYSDYEIGFMCSKAEGFGRVTVEYMMAGLCVIASDTGANQELISDSISGYIYKYKDKKGLAETIKKVVENPNEAFLCAKRAEEDARNKYSLDKNIEEICKVYFRVLESVKR